MNRSRFLVHRLVLAAAWATLFSIPGVRAQEITRCILLDSIGIEGNKVTAETVILRELTVKPGDMLDRETLMEALDQGRKNLLNTGLFNFVDIAVELTGADSLPCLSVLVRIRLTERWYIWPLLILEYEDRNFNAWLAKRDISRVSYGITLTHNNFRGHKEYLALTLQHGYDRQLWFEYRIPYIDRRKVLGLFLAGGKQQMHEVPFATIDGRRAYLKDLDTYVFDRRFMLGGLSYRPGMHTFHEFRLGIEDLRWGDTLLAANPLSSASADGKECYLWMHYKVKFDHRDIAAYPLSGWYADLEFQQDGFGLFRNGGPDRFFLKSTLRKYFILDERVFLAAAAHLKLGANKPVPYYLNKGLGFERDIVRGYEHYVIDGQSFAVLKGNLKYEVLPRTSFHFPLPLTERLVRTHIAIYANLYADAGRVRDAWPAAGNILANSWLTGYGCGLDFVTYYDKVVRLEFSVNHLGEGGLFIHFIAPV